MKSKSNTALRIVEPESQPTIESPETTIAKLEAELAELESKSYTAENAAAIAQSDFEANPSPDTHTAAAVATQLSRNAVKAIDTWQNANGEALASARKAKLEADFEVVRVELAKNATITELTAEVARIIRQCERDLSAKFVELGAAVVQRNQLLSQARVLNAALGNPDPDSYASVSPSAIVDHVGAAITPANSAYSDTQIRLGNDHTNLNRPRFQLTITAPLPKEVR